MTTVGDIRTIMDTAYPPHLAESWDKVGLICGDPAAEVRHVVFALDCTDAVVQAAIDAGAQMIITHHPLLLKSVTSVAADTPKGRVIHRLIQENIALFAAHTNADSARGGVNDVLAETLGLIPGASLSTVGEPHIDRWTVMVPLDAAEAVKQAMFAAGAGSIGTYTDCAFSVVGEGQFTPTEAANPTIGQANVAETVAEQRITMIAPRHARHEIYAAMVKAHPYEVVAHECVTLNNTTPPEEQTGIGRICSLPEPMTFAEFVQQVADRLPTTVWGVRAAGDPAKMVHTVAVASGAGDSFLDQVARSGVDAFVTSDLRHHPVDEYLRAGGPAIIDTAHWASESPWLASAAKLLEENAKVQTTVLDVRTDPWTISAHSQDAQQAQ
ncbi:Nif3-like dinuclear metal center hexameric protein [Corynebacterium choanae]|uniref:GTP cyclohydrolase 1 type 2 homolog n=1 Tax=Corynebacterium choanae TaxID=1862358 RepID=A0A3G6J880_9CORY|nr:Nif3-like dinuclear metal center hexameric protein [Corynebacterium choanae]AZA14012.1 Putative GTP cyclohydrolase 1 type 2 [Corynebacterium choanae]